MKKISEKMLKHLSSGVTTLCYCWKLKLKNGLEYGFTECDHNLKIDGIIYNAKSGFNPSAVSSNSDLSVDNLDIEGMLDNEVISEEAILAGDFDFAEIEIFIVNYNDLSMDKILVRKGWFGEINFSNNRFTTEVRGLTQALSKNIGDLYSPVCRATFCDEKCGLNAEHFSIDATISAKISDWGFEIEGVNKENGYFNNGKMIFSNGDLIEVKSFFNNRIETALPYYRSVITGEKITLVAGCDKAFQTCCEKFKNAENFRGEPHVPGTDKISFFL